jgi:DNA invertase Pin-like site-specific DNA recombinase
MLMKYGYARVSSLVQLKGNSLEEQKQELLKAGVLPENIVEEQYSGKTTDRPLFKELLSRLQSGDSLVCCKLDRFARNVEDGLKTVRELVEQGVTVDILNLGRIDNTATGKLILTIMLAFAEFERNMILERTAAGRAVARTKEGYCEGRPRIARAKINHAMNLLVSHSYSEVSEMTGISKSTLQRYLRERRHEEQAALLQVPRKGSQGPEDEQSLFDFSPNKRPGRPKNS